MERPKDRMMLFTGNANRALAENLAKSLETPLGEAKVSAFSDGELNIEIKENVRGRDIFVVQPLCNPADTHLMELLLMIDAMYRASASRVTAVIPYFGYCRQDRRVRFARVPISAKVVADMIGTVATKHVLTMDLHSDQMQGFFNVPLDNIYASPVLAKDIIKQEFTQPIVVSPDVGGVVRARAIAKMVGDVDLAIIDKRRPEENVCQVMNVIGNVKNKTCIIIDDIVDTAGTLKQAAQALHDKGASHVYAYATHAVLSGNAVENINTSPLDALVTTDTIPLQLPAIQSDKIRQISATELFAESIQRIYREESISSLFSD